jgi:hypothetical protein
MVEDLRAARYQIEMTVGHRIEAAGIDGFNGIHATGFYQLRAAGAMRTRSKSEAFAWPLI